MQLYVVMNLDVVIGLFRTDPIMYLPMCSNEAKEIYLP